MADAYGGRAKLYTPKYAQLPHSRTLLQSSHEASKGTTAEVRLTRSFTSEYVYFNPLSLELPVHRGTLMNHTQSIGH